MSVDLWIWGAFVAFILGMLALDLFVFHRDPREVTLRESVVASGIWIGLGLAFGLVLWLWQGAETAAEYYAGYLIEKALSVDNVFVFTLIFAHFAVPRRYQHRVLFWGVVGALAMRGALIAGGTELLSRFEWVAYLFGALLVVTGLRFARRAEHAVAPGRNPVVWVLRRIVPMTDEYLDGRLLLPATEVAPDEVTGGRPLVGRCVATPLLAVLVVIETTDLIFAVDSIPAILAITANPFVVFSSNAFALLGLRALYFVVENVVQRFVYLRIGLAVILVLVGVKFLARDLAEHLPVYMWLGVIAAIVAGSIGASVWKTRTGERDRQSIG